MPPLHIQTTHGEFNNNLSHMKFTFNFQEKGVEYFIQSMKLKDCIKQTKIRTH